MQIVSGDFLRILCEEGLNLVFHMDTPARESDFRVQLSEVHVLERLSFNLFSLYHVQRKQRIVLKDAGVHLFDNRLVGPRGVNGSSLSATRLPPSVLHEGMIAVYGSPLPPFRPVP